MAVLVGHTALGEPIATEGNVFQIADGAREEPYCQEGEYYAPDGMVTQVGSRTFRLCSRPSGEHGERLVRVTLNPDIVPGLSDDGILMAMRLDDRLSFAAKLENVKQGHEPIGIRMFGDSPYVIFNGGRHDLNGFLNLATYVPVLTDGKIEPDHFIRCLNENNIPNQNAACSLVIQYFDVVSTLNFYYLGAGSPMLSFDRLSDLPAEVFRVLRMADVTDAASQSISRLPIVE